MSGYEGYVLFVFFIIECGDFMGFDKIIWL